MEIADDLCDPCRAEGLIESTRGRFVVFGGCGMEEGGGILARLLRREGHDTFAMRCVDLKHHWTSEQLQPVATERAKLLLLAATLRARCYRGVPRQSVKRFTAFPKGAMSRRGFLRGALAPSTEAIPYVAGERCEPARCSRCLDACPMGAIAKREGQVWIEGARCTGCGVCTRACPREAIVHPTYRPEQIEAEVRGILSPLVRRFESRVIAFSCAAMGSPAGRLPESGHPVPPSVFEIPVPCLGFMSGHLVLKAFELGAAGVVLIPCQEPCRLGASLDPLLMEIRFAQQFLGRIGLGADRLAVLPPAVPHPAALAGALSGFVEAIRPLGVRRPSASEETGGEESALRKIRPVHSLARAFGADHDMVMQHPGAPCGAAEVQESRCTLCGLCAAECPSGALSLSPASGSARLVFDYSRCECCELCVRACPERAMVLRRVLDLARLESASWEVLATSPILACPRCGARHIPRASLNAVRTRISREGTEELFRSLELCWRCRRKALVGYRKQ
ncbi:MAG: 4Fe-4S binding protein [candidate division NC10 bacterium]|nr:4Fe-4S binding protein [candidate division NC10 bacterium]